MCANLLELENSKQAILHAICCPTQRAAHRRATSKHIKMQSNPSALLDNKVDPSQLLDDMRPSSAPARDYAPTFVEYDDPVHGTTLLPEIVKVIVRTEHFQRLRYVKQLGACNFVFRDAGHTRYEHSLGVACLCVRFMDTLDENSSTTCDTTTDAGFFKLCVILAGLLHDIGHGPFSHMWEPFVHECGTDKHWHHEAASCDVATYLFNTHFPMLRIAACRRRHLQGVRLVSALIRGDTEFCARILGPRLNYLAEIVNNKFCLIDVDKWDYLVRDVHHLHADAMRVPIDSSFVELFQRARVVREPPPAQLGGVVLSSTGAISKTTKPIDGERRTHVAFHEQTIAAVRALFANRALMHRQCYQNTRVVACEILLRRGFRLAEEAGFRFEGHRLSECHRVRGAYKSLNDSVLQAIEEASVPAVEEGGGGCGLRAAHEMLALVRRPHAYAVEFEVATQTVFVKMLKHDNDGKLHIDPERTMSYRLNLPDAYESLPERLIVYDDDGWTEEVNPKTYQAQADSRC